MIFINKALAVAVLRYWFDKHTPIIYPPSTSISMLDNYDSIP